MVTMFPTKILLEKSMGWEKVINLKTNLIILIPLHFFH